MWSQLFLGALGLLAPVLTTARPSFTTINDTQWLLTNGDSFEMTINSQGYAYSMKWNDRELVGNATGGYTDTGGRTTFNFTSAPQVVAQTDDKIHVAFDSYFGIVHYILFSGLNGHYQYVVNKNLGQQGEVRSLYRLDPLLFTSGRTQCRDDILPPIADIQSGVNVQDETWIRQDGSYITKYDFSCFSRGQQYHGVHGDGLGAWIIAPGLDYYIGDHMKQELMVHRESKTNDAVMLHYYHGTHYMSDFSNLIPQGKMFGPWLFYINDGNQGDATARSQMEDTQWPYRWVNDTNYQNRGTVKGRLMLSDGRPASGAAVFLGDENGWETNNQGTNYQYTSYAEDDGHFTFQNVRLEKNYRMIAWSNGGAIADVDGVHNGTMVGLNGSSIDLGSVTWDIPSREIAWRIGDFDKKTTGFKLGGSPYQHGLSDYTPANLIYSIGVNKTSDWYFAQSSQGNWSVLFDPAVANRSATLTLSFAGFTSRSGFNLSDPTVTGLNVSMNQVQFASFGPERPSDKSLYRSATTAGAYYSRQFDVPANLFSTTKFNRLDLALTGNQRWRGIMWDALKLEWN